MTTTYRGEKHVDKVAKEPVPFSFKNRFTGEMVSFYTDDERSRYVKMQKDGEFDKKPEYISRRGRLQKVNRDKRHLTPQTWKREEKETVKEISRERRKNDRPKNVSKYEYLMILRMAAQMKKSKATMKK